MDFIKIMREKAKKAQKRLVLSDGTDVKVIQAARIILDAKLAGEVTLIGGTDAVAAAAEKESVCLDGIQVLCPAASPDLPQYTALFNSLKQHTALEGAVTSPLCWAAMMLRHGAADALVAGPLSTETDVLTVGGAVIGTAAGFKTISSCLAVQTKDERLGVNGAFIFADCSVITVPSAEELAGIACAAANSARSFLDADPVVAFLSLLSNDESCREQTQKVRTAMEILKKRTVNFPFGGGGLSGSDELDFILDAERAHGGYAANALSGRTVNTLIFPDAQSGSIAYKILQRLGNTSVYGPFLQGFAKPAGSISPRASIEDIVVHCAVQLAQHPA
ncbi:MAG: phosphate acetyltransferase [Spirochaetaceae bacterium]|jgi:phosphate acetyltransferase|nr:phosphate acetyltransferase [Spirochaetaceae bacterium]